ncbi:MAG: L-threonylcarbamoyladenylate synthase [Verrucomicrobiota bacterium]
MKTQTVAAIYDRRRRSQTAATEPAVKLLQEGEVVALPTETVYGLAADALKPEAVLKIFEAKERPHFDPLIVHLPDLGWFERVADVPTQEKQLVMELIGRFWPGPFTLVTAKRGVVPEIVTAGLQTVAVRISAHPVFSEVIQAFGGPLAAPSANRFGKISPTEAHHVLDELDGRIPMILDGGSTLHGVESTVVSVTGGKIRILRPGPVTREQLSDFAQVEIAPATEKISAPGQLPSHYAPTTPLKLRADLESPGRDGKNQRIGLLAWSDCKIEKSYAMVRNLSERGDLHEAALNLFRYLRELDQANLDLIIAQTVPETCLGVAINDRLRRAQSR